MTESATNLADLAVRPTYEQVLQSINHSEVQRLLRDAQANERRLDRELEYIKQDEDLTTEARERKAQELIDRFSPRISKGYARAKRMVETSAKSSYRFSLPFPEGKTFAQARARDTGELLAVQGEAEAMAAKISGKSLQEMTKAVSRHPKDRGIRETSSHTTDALRKEFDKAMSQSGVECRVKAMAIERVCEQMGIDLEEVVDSHRTDRHRRALEDARRFERAWHVIPSGKKPLANPFAAKRDSTRRIGTYSNTSPLVRQPDGANVFQKKRRRPWK